LRLFAYYRFALAAVVVGALLSTGSSSWLENLRLP
jgi:hypothetical protein